MPAMTVEEMEQTEIDGSATTDLYTRLMAQYLLAYDLRNAQLLWKRIPTSMKQPENELCAVWKVGQEMIKREPPSIYDAIESRQWSEQISPIMEQLLKKTRERMCQLVGKAYSTIRIGDFERLTRLSKDAALEQVSTQGWSYEAGSGMITPLRAEDPPCGPILSEAQVAKLAEYVSLLDY